MSEPERKRCAHDPRPYRRIAGGGINMHTGKYQRLRFHPQCPHTVTEGSDYCMPHSVFHGGLSTREWAIRENIFQETVLHYMARGLLILPMIPNAPLMYPAWWPSRVN